MAIAYHTHSFEIPAATDAETQAGAVSDKVVVPSGLASLLASYVTSTALTTTLADYALTASIGVTIQAYDADLAAIANLTSAADKLPYATGAGTWSLADFTSAARALLDDADAAAQRATLGLGTAATTDATAYATAAQGATADTAIQPGSSRLVPAGGATGQVLAKTSGTDYATEWTAAGIGDMVEATYDPSGVGADAFNAANHEFTASGGVAVGVGSVLSRVLTPAMFGAVGDGATDDTVALQAMFAVAGTREFDGLGKTYAISETVLVERGDIVVRNLFTTGVIANTTASIKFLGTLDTAVNLSSSAAIGAITLDVDDGTAFSVNQWVWVRSDDLLWSTSTFGEMAKIRDISGNTLTLNDPIFLYYNTAATGRVIPINALENIVIENSGVYGDVSVTDQIGFEFQYCVNVEVRNPRTEDCEYVHHWFKTCADCRIIGGMGERTGVEKGLNYGVVTGESCNNFLLQGYTGRTMRHVLATGGSLGINRNIRAYHNVALDALDAGFDAHPQTAECDYSHNTVHFRIGASSGGDGLICQGADFTAKANKIFNSTRHGVFFQPNLAITGVPNRCLIEGNQAETVQSSGTTAGVNVLAGVTGSNIESAGVHGNTCKGYTNGAFAAATAANISDLTVSGQKSLNNTGRGVMVQATTGRTVTRGTISGSTVLQAPGAFEAILLTSVDAGGVSDFAVTGNSTSGGTYGVRGANTNYIATTGNVAKGATTLAFSVAGASSVTANNAS